MSRSLSNPAVAALMGQETEQVFLLLLTISHAAWTEPVRVVNNNVNITSNGNLFVAYPFEIILPGDSAEQLPRVTLKIDNVDRSIVQAVREATSPPDMTLQVVLASSPDTVEIEFANMRLEHVEYDALIVTGEITFENVLTQAFPAGTFNPSTNPGLF